MFQVFEGPSTFVVDRCILSGFLLVRHLFTVVIMVVVVARIVL